MNARTQEAARPAPRALQAARLLVIACVIGLMFSPALANTAELVLFILMLGVGALRRRLWLALRQPLVTGALAFYAVMLLGLTYTAADWPVAFGMLHGWRKILLLPIAVALFDEVRSKLALLQVFVGIAAGAALVSFGGAILGSGPAIGATDLAIGIVVRNHAAQGMLFAAAAFGAAALVLMETGRRRWGWAALALLLVANVVLVTPGRSGYIVLLASTATLGMGWVVIRYGSAWRALAAGGVLATLLLGALLASPVARERIDLAVNEVVDYRQAREITSMGIRMHFWRNAVSLIEQRPFIGWGTGSYGPVYEREVAGREGIAGVVTNDPHNQFLKIAAEHGLLGLGVFLGFLLMALRQRPRAEFRMLGLGVLGAWCATSLANSHFSTFVEGSFLYLWLGVMLANESAPSG